MSFDELVQWVGDALDGLDSSLDRVRHLNRLHKTLMEHGPNAEHVKDWHALARKCADFIGQPRPALPEVARSRTRGKAGPARRIGLRVSKKKPRASRPKGQQYEISGPFREALDAIANGEPLLFVTGRAGTGKSTFIQMLRAELPKKNIVVLAPTGIAALNAGGQTIHSFFLFPPRVIDLATITAKKESEVFEKMDILVIDEVSMVRADLLDAVEVALRVNRKSAHPFGGVQVVLVGDLFQLPPVPPRGDDALALRTRYRSLQFFGADSIRSRKMKLIELTRVFRQADQAFVSLLGDLRVGANLAEACAALNQHCAGRRPDGPHLVLVPKNDAADRENASRIEKLAGRPRTYIASLQGSFQDKHDRLPAPRELTLKPGAQVMFTKNDPERRWVNGTTGVVTALSKETIEVLLENGSTHDVEPETWENIRYEFDSSEQRIIEEVVGSYEQFPLMPAWAVTIHKAQGLTLSRVHVDFGSGAFAEGQAYVALSRCRRLTDLTLARPLRVNDIKASVEIVTFYSSLAPRIESLSIATDGEELVLTDRERELIAENLEFYRSLAGGLRSPATEAQRHFVDAAHGRVAAEGEHEKAYEKWRRIDESALSRVV